MKRQRTESGFALLLVFALAAIGAVMLYMQLPVIAFEAQRDKEDLLITRGEEYRRAIQLFFRKTRQFPASLDQLESFNNLRFLRRRYKDPMTGKDEWRLVHIGPGGVFTDSVTMKAPEAGKEKKDETASAGDSTAAPNETGMTRLTTSRRRRGGEAPGGETEITGSTPAASPFQPPTQPPPPGTITAYQTNQPGDPAAPPVQVAPPGVQFGGGYTQTPPGQATGWSQQMQGNPPVQVVAGQMIAGQVMTGQVAPGQPYPSYPGTPAGFPVAGRRISQIFPGFGQPANSQTGGVSPVPFPTPQTGGGFQPQDAPSTQRGGIFTPPGGSGTSSTNPALEAIQKALTTPRPGGFPGTSGATGGTQFGAGIAGVASKMEAEGIKVYNEKTKYNEWEFIYDMRKDRLMGGGGTPVPQGPQQQQQQQQSDRTGTGRK